MRTIILSPLMLIILCRITLVNCQDNLIPRAPIPQIIKFPGAQPTTSIPKDPIQPTQQPLASEIPKTLAAQPTPTPTPSPVIVLSTTIKYIPDVTTLAPTATVVDYVADSDSSDDDKSSYNKILVNLWYIGLFNNIFSVTHHSINKIWFVSTLIS
ncbi:hypothetical protein C1645_875437 [Glomus cerebriforme]|uniref:Uncharacterized protein n=1 Tax=Glomus cerebriforme TaxID=658196 RepID=A0A397SZF1_9GLOM|nr:hypothetical protein C1645_875437 [Glomus cerebriforme]